MRTSTQWLLGALAALILLLAAAVFTVSTLADPNRYKGKIEAIVSNLTGGRPFVIKGNLELTWFPWLSVRMGAAQLGAQPKARSGAQTGAGTGAETGAGTGASTSPLIEWQEVQVGAKLVPLLRGKLVIDRVRLRGLRLHLRRDAQGHGNWEGLTGPSDDERRDTPAGTPAGRRDGTRGGARGEHPELSTGHSGDSQLPLEVAGVEIRDGELEYVDETTGTSVSLSEWQLDVGAWRPDQPFSVRTRAVLREPSLPPGGLPIQFDAPELTVRTSPLAVTIPKLSARVADSRIEGAATVEQALSVQQTSGAEQASGAGPASGPIRAAGTLTMQVPSARKLLADLAVKTALPRDPTTLGALALTGNWTFTAGALALKPLTVTMDGMTLKGWVQRSGSSPPEWTFELEGDRIDLGRYADLDNAHKKPFVLPVDALKALRVQGSVLFDHAQLADARMKNVRLRLQTNGMSSTSDSGGSGTPPGGSRSDPAQ